GFGLEAVRAGGDRKMQKNRLTGELVILRRRAFELAMKLVFEAIVAGIQFGSKPPIQFVDVHCCPDRPPRREQRVVRAQRGIDEALGGGVELLANCSSDTGHCSLPYLPTFAKVIFKSTK